LKNIVNTLRNLFITLNDMPDKKNLPFFIFSIAVFVLLILPWVLQDGMFMDGLQYAVAAKNLANGNGTPWNLFISKYMNSSFHDQPPLTLWIESAFFRMLGNSIYTERIYSFLTACISGILVMVIWKLIYQDKPEEKKISWLPFLLWIMPPVCFWSYANNMEENTMGIFILLSVWSVLKGLQQDGNLIYLIAGGLCIFLSSFCKGIQGMFPLALPFIHWLVCRNISFAKTIAYSFILFLIPALIYFVMFQNKEINDFYLAYFNARLYPTFNSLNTATTTTRFYIFFRLLSELSGPVLLCTILFFIFRLKSFNYKTEKSQRQIIILFLLIGISGSLPLMITLEQRRFYLVPSLPYYAIALASWIAPAISSGISRINSKNKYYRGFKFFSLFLLIASLIFSFLGIGKTKRDNDLLHDVYAIGSIVPHEADITIPPAIIPDWSMHLYFDRLYTISLDPDTLRKHPFFLMQKDMVPPDSKMYSEIKSGLKIYRIYKSVK
jgi:4-amino-4-deoxy-L-arabinose transferase-like glycosyltransferase